MKPTNTKPNEEHPETRWLSRLDQIVQENLAVSNFNNESLAEQMAISERHLFRRVKALTGLAPQQYVRRYRLRRAMRQLETGVYRTVQETAAAAGYANTSYFISQFEREFGRKPLDVLREAGWR